ncbi:hypothetical protein ACH4UM_21530 [Streptomyces sp. NPDC020801]|uniref:hypothetical protein n=1 Tax=unclassified Streptomyces TaxID=2593676 RepID=UPI0037906C69
MSASVPTYPTLGDDRFFPLLRGWHQAHRGSSADTAAFIAHAGRYSPTAVEPLLHSWLHEKQLPPMPPAPS